MKIAFIFVAAIILSSCSSAIRFASGDAHSSEPVSMSAKAVLETKTPKEDSREIVRSFEGYASYYADKFHGRRTASGEPYDKNEFTAAHKSLPFGTKVLVTNLENDLTVGVVITDRGPFVKGRVVDLSRAAAEQIDMIRRGVVRVRVDVLK